MNTPNNKILALRHMDLVKRADEIFGPDVVVNAWVVVDSIREPTLHNMTSVRRDLALYDVGEDPKVLPLETNGAIMLEFRSGAKVTFGTSEWGELTRIDDCDIIEL